MWESAYGMVTDQQVRRLFRLSNMEKTQEIAASKAGMDVKTARKYLRARVLPSERKTERHWRTRKDEFCDVWAEVKEQLNATRGWRQRPSSPLYSENTRNDSRTGNCAPYSGK